MSGLGTGRDHSEEPVPYGERARSGDAREHQDSLVVLRGVTRTYVRGADTVTALRALDLSVRPGEMLAMIGPSGSGKTTLMFVLAGWEVPDSGEVAVDPSLSSRTVADLPWREMAIVPQSLGLLEELTIAENVALPARLDSSATMAIGSGASAAEPAGRQGSVSSQGRDAGSVRSPVPPDWSTADGGGRDELEGAVERVLASLDLELLAQRLPSEVSLGEQQRTAMARALLLEPRIVLVDEPTTHQDRKRADQVLDALHRAATRGSAVVVATHDHEILDHAERVVEIRDGAASWRC